MSNGAGDVLMFGKEVDDHYFLEVIEQEDPRHECACGEWKPVKADRCRNCERQEKEAAAARRNRTKGSAD